MLNAVDPVVREMASPFTQPLTRSQQIEKDRQVREKAQPAGVSKILARARRKAQEEEQRKRTLAAQLQQPNAPLPASPHASSSASASAASAPAAAPPTKPAVGPASYSKKSEPTSTSTGTRTAPVVADHSLLPTTTAAIATSAATATTTPQSQQQQQQQQQQRLLNRPVSASRGGTSSTSKGGSGAEKIFVTETGSGSSEEPETAADEPESVAPSSSAAPDHHISKDFERATIFPPADKDTQAKRTTNKSPPAAVDRSPPKDKDDVLVHSISRYNLFIQSVDTIRNLYEYMYFYCRTRMKIV